MLGPVDPAKKKRHDAIAEDANDIFNNFEKIEGRKARLLGEIQLLASLVTTTAVRHGMPKDYMEDMMRGIVGRAIEASEIPIHKLADIDRSAQPIFNRIIDNMDSKSDPQP